MRVLIVAGLLGLANLAPLQCASDRDPDLRSYETPGEALYGLAGEFKARGDVEAWRSTLEYLIRRYPSSRFALMAKTDLKPPEAAHSE